MFTKPRQNFQLFKKVSYNWILICKKCWSVIELSLVHNQSHQNEFSLANGLAELHTIMDQRPPKSRQQVFGLFALFDILQNLKCLPFAVLSKSENLLGLCKIDSWIWTIFSFVLYTMTWWSVLVMVTTIFDKTQARARKSIFCLKSNKNVVVNHFELIRDKLKILFGAENSGLKWGSF